MQMQLPVSFSISRKKASLAQAEIAPQPRESGGGLMARTGSIEHSIQAVVSDARNVRAWKWLLSPFLVHHLYLLNLHLPGRGQTNSHVHSCDPAELPFVP